MVFRIFKQLRLHAVDHLVRSLLEGGHNEHLNLVAMILGRLVLGIVNFL